MLHFNPNPDRETDQSMEASEPLSREHASSLHSGNNPGQPGQEALAVRPWRHLLDALADAAGVTASQGEIDAASKSLIQPGVTTEQIETSAAQSGIAPAALSAFIRANVLTPKIEQVLAPNATPEQQQPIFQQALVTIANQLGVTVNPRYGSWSSDSIKLGAPPSDLSIPPAG